MKILVSACLLGKNCKYNGGNNLNQSVLDFIEGHEVIGVCPEQLGGLSTPRLPAEIVDGVVTNKEGVSVDAEFRKGRRQRWQLLWRTRWIWQFCSRAVPAAA